MSKTLAGFLVAATAVVGLASAANAQVLYINSDGSMSTVSTDVMPLSSTLGCSTCPITTDVLTQPAVITHPAVIDTAPVVTSPVLTTPIIQTSPVFFDRPRRSLFHLGVGDLFNLRLF